tara:strand:+ start:344 stop:646 length:303 start_codon:yes stop_codon:yes gene_type:complete
MTAFDKAWKFVKYEAVSTGGAAADSGFGNPNDGKLQTALDTARNQKPRPPLKLRGLRRSTEREARSDDPLVRRALEALRNEKGGYNNPPDPRGDKDTTFA